MHFQARKRAPGKNGAPSRRTNPYTCATAFLYCAPAVPDAQALFFVCILVLMISFIN